MAQQMSEFQQFLDQEIKMYQGICVPVKAGLLRRALIRRVPTRLLHPNPDDEFCDPAIGPNEGIIADYGREIVQRKHNGEANCFAEQIIVQKMRPSGYLILNGHHRWAAAVRWHVPKVPVAITDLTSEEDVRKMLAGASSDKRAVFDLDEVVFCPQDSSDPCEKPLPCFLKRIYKEKVRLGIPALFSFFRQKGYDVWVYSAKLYSMDYIRNMFRHYHVHLTGIVTGTGRKLAEADREKKKQLEADFRKACSITLNVTSRSLVRVDSRTGVFDEYELGKEEIWSSEVMNIVREIEQHEKQSV